MTTPIKSTCALSALALISLSSSVIAQKSCGCHCDTSAVTSSQKHHHHHLAPIGVSGDHTHAQGDWMVSLRHMTMEMNQIFRGAHTIPSNMAATGYMMSPTTMRMDMEMLGIMYAPTDKLTLMLMTNYQSKSMDMANAAGATVMHMETSGIGDTSLSALYSVFKAQKSSMHVGLGISLPTGATDKKISSSPMPAAIGRDQPFAMQLGSGTIDFTPSVTFNQMINHQWSWGTQLKTTLRTSENDAGYRLGNSIESTSWISRQLTSNISLSGRVSAKSTSGIHGDQRNGLHTLNPAMSLPANPANSGGKEIGIFIGASYLSPNGLRMSIELGKPLYQELNGSQLGNDYSVSLGLQYVW